MQQLDARNAPENARGVYKNGRVVTDPETLRQLAGFSEREIASKTGLHRKPIRLFRHGGR